MCRLAGKPAVENVASIPPEGYEISITKDGVKIRASGDAGVFYARMTLRQLERNEEGSKRKTYPCAEIADAPKFKWRGIHLDCVRHFFGKSAIKHLIDEMSWYKLNVFHWHLTDNQGWTIEIPGYPKLVREGRGKEFGEKIGPFYYSDNDIKEIVAYAAKRHVKVVPELEFPGHFGAAARAYPDFECPNAKKHAWRGVMCLGNPEALRFAEKALDRVCELFPSDVIHIGGDECPRTNWSACPRCAELIGREGLSGAEALQPWFTSRITRYLSAKGRRAIAWDEIFDNAGNALPAETMGMGWRGKNAGVKAAGEGHQIVRCPNVFCYFNYSQCLPEDPYRYWGQKKGLSATLEKVYSFDPLDGVDEASRGNILGGQCCAWSSSIAELHELEWKLWPRALALAEVLWTYPDPSARDFDGFRRRANVHRLRLVRANVNCARGWE